MLLVLWFGGEEWRGLFGIYSGCYDYFGGRWFSWYDRTVRNVTKWLSLCCVIDQWDWCVTYGWDWTRWFWLLIGRMGVGDMVWFDGLMNLATCSGWCWVTGFDGAVLFWKVDIRASGNGEYFFIYFHFSSLRWRESILNFVSLKN